MGSRAPVATRGISKALARTETSAAVGSSKGPINAQGGPCSCTHCSPLLLFWLASNTSLISRVNVQSLSSASSGTITVSRSLKCLIASKAPSSCELPRLVPSVPTKSEPLPVVKGTRALMSQTPFGSNLADTVRTSKRVVATRRYDWVPIIILLVLGR